MDEKRRNEISYMVLKYYLQNNGVEISYNKMRELGNLAKAIGVTTEELKEFAQPLIHEFIDQVFAAKPSENKGGGH